MKRPYLQILGNGEKFDGNVNKLIEENSPNIWKEMFIWVQENQMDRVQENQMDRARKRIPHLILQFIKEKKGLTKETY